MINDIAVTTNRTGSVKDEVLVQLADLMPDQQRPHQLPGLVDDFLAYLEQYRQA